MQSKVAPFAATPDPTYGRQSSPASHELVVAPDDTGSSEEADLRLVIEEDQATGAIIYKTINRATGQVVQQFSRDVILKMREDADYAAGGVIRTKA
ncbi:MAG: flaG [Phenylobacterium sp.]|nr:flaG [Phenylobacterium sp.]